MKFPIPIIDLFAGPGGLSEGFSSYFDENGIQIFKVKLSIEKDKAAHKTLLLRSFFRQFNKNEIPSSYYNYLKGEISRELLFKKYPKQAANARKEAWRIELNKSNRLKVKNRINSVLEANQDWVLIGGPPCQAYSLAGRSRMQGQNKKKFLKDRRHFLYKEYLQILADNQPAVFILENVKGLLSSKIKGKNTFDLIINDLTQPLNQKRNGSEDLLYYDLFSISKKRTEEGKLFPEDFIVKAEDYGIPQARHRIFIVGIRSDKCKSEIGLLKKEDQVNIEDVISDLPKIRSGISKIADSPDVWKNSLKSILDQKWVQDEPRDFSSIIKKTIEKTESNLSLGQPYLECYVSPNHYTNWYIDNKLKGICNHESRKHMVNDLIRYMFASIYAGYYDRSPTLSNFPKELLPKHKNVINSDKKISAFNDRFRVQIQGKPSTTIVSHISKDGHYYIHYDPLQCRSLTVREAARLQTFPDNYFFEGTKTEQYHQVGNAVPPMLAEKIAEIIHLNLL